MMATSDYSTGTPDASAHPLRKVECDHMTATFYIHMRTVYLAGGEATYEQPQFVCRGCGLKHDLMKPYKTMADVFNQLYEK